MSAFNHPGLRYKILCVAIAVFIFLIAALPVFPDFFAKMESAFYDLKLRLAGPVQGAEDIVLLNIDDATLRELGKWPLDRGTHAKAVETLSRCGAETIVFDIVFHGHGSSEGDHNFEEALKNNGSVFLPAGFSLLFENEVIDIPLGDLKPILEKSFLKTSIPELSNAMQADRSFLPLPSLAAQARAIGQISASPDNDGVLRRIPLAISVNGQVLPSLDLAVAIHLLGIKSVRWDQNRFVLAGENRDISIPVDKHGHMAVRFAGSWGNGFTHLSYADVIAAAGDPEAESDLTKIIGGKTVFIGLTSSGSTDIGPTPVSTAEPLITIHSNAVNTILQNKFIHTVPSWGNILSGVVLIALICLLAVKFGPRRYVVLTAALLLFFSGINFGLFFYTGVMLNFSGIIYSAMSCFLVVLGLKSLLLFAENEARRIERDKLQIQLDAAAKIQSHFWPETPNLGEGNKIFAYSSPALFVGGDLYDIIPLDDGSWIIYLADVSGKGLPAALVMASAWTQIRTHAARIKQPDVLLNAVNQAMYPFLEKNSNFVTVLLLRYYPDSGNMQYVNGGHMQPLILGHNGIREVYGKTSMPLGIFEQADYSMAETTLTSGESCIMMSDGVTEAENESKELFGEERVTKTLLAARASSRGQSLADAVKKWRNGIKQNDDTTIVEIFRG